METRENIIESELFSRNNSTTTTGAVATGTGGSGSDENGKNDDNFKMLINHHQHHHYQQQHPPPISQQPSSQQQHPIHYQHPSANNPHHQPPSSQMLHDRGNSNNQQHHLHDGQPTSADGLDNSIEGRLMSSTMPPHNANINRSPPNNNNSSYNDNSNNNNNSNVSISSYQPVSSGGGESSSNLLMHSEDTMGSEGTSNAGDDSNESNSNQNLDDSVALSTGSAEGGGDGQPPAANLTSITTDEDSPDPNAKKYKCSECNKIYMREFQLNTHFRRHHADKLKSLDSTSPPKNNSWTPESMDEALDALKNERLTLIKASHQYGIPASTLWQRATRLGIMMPKNGARTSSKDGIADAVQLLKTGQISVNKASKVFGIPPSTLYKIAKREGIQLSSPFNTASTSWTQENLQLAMDAIRAGQMSVHMASVEYKIPPGTLYGRCKREGLELSRSNPVQWSSRDLKNALEAVKTGQMSINQASEHYKISYSSLYKRVKPNQGHNNSNNKNNAVVKIEPPDTDNVEMLQQDQQMHHQPAAFMHHTQTLHPQQQQQQHHLHHQQQHHYGGQPVHHQHVIHHQSTSLHHHQQQQQQHHGIPHQQQIVRQQSHLHQPPPIINTIDPLNENHLTHPQQQSHHHLHHAHHHQQQQQHHSIQHGGNTNGGGATGHIQQQQIQLTTTEDGIRYGTTTNILNPCDEVDKHELTSSSGIGLVSLRIDCIERVL